MFILTIIFIITHSFGLTVKLILRLIVVLILTLTRTVILLLIISISPPLMLTYTHISARIHIHNFILSSIHSLRFTFLLILTVLHTLIIDTHAHACTHIHMPYIHLCFYTYSDDDDDDDDDDLSASIISYWFPSTKYAIHNHRLIHRSISIRIN